MKVLVTGAAGFIGFHTAQKLLARGDKVVGLDNINDYYEPQLKYDRLALLTPQPNFSFHKIDLTERETMQKFFAENPFDRIVHLAAYAGVRYSVTHPYAYIDSNVQGFINILEGARAQNVQHLVYASSSSVYGANTQMPFAVTHNVDHPLSLYAATKKANELMAHCYAHLYRVPMTGLRFFTVYGPWGRPDMALFLFTKAIIEDRAIDVFNYGKMQRDFTYIDDIVEGVIRVLDKPAAPDENWSENNPATSNAPYRIYNIGGNRQIELNDFIAEIEKNLGKTAKRNLLPIQDGDVPASFADVSALVRDLNYQPQTTVQTGIANFVKWYKEYYKI